MTFIKRARTKAPDYFVRTDNSSPIHRGLVGAWFPTQGTDLFNAVNGDIATNENPSVVTEGFDNNGRFASVNNVTGTGTGYGYDVGDPDYLKISSEITIIARVRLRADPGQLNWGRAVSKTDGGTGDNWGMIFNASSSNEREVTFRLNNNSLNYTTQLNAEQFYTIICRYKSGTREILVDGVVVRSDSLTGAITTTGNVKIGNHGAAISRGLRGDIYSVMIYDRFVNDSDIEMRMIAANPYQILQQEQIYLPLAAAPAGDAVLSSAGVAVTSFTGAALSDSTLSSEGAASTNLTASAIADAVFSSAGVGTTSFVSDSGTSAMLSSAGASTVALTAGSLFNSTLTSSGIATTAFVASTAGSVLSSDGNSFVAFTGAAQINAVLSSAGTSAVSFLAGSNLVNFNSSGSSSVSFVSKAIAAPLQLDRLPLDPYLPHNDSITALRTRMYDVYKNIAIQSNKIAEEIDKLNKF